jgi:peptidoglycan/xylan/chitin deacetylase (PgdA/CDA1 family)
VRGIGRLARAVVLMYHRIADAPRDPGEGDYVVSPERFRAQMDWLARSRRPVVGAERLAAPGLPDGAVALTFDDGCDSDLLVTLPLLRRLGLSATFFVTPGRLGAPGYLTPEQLRALAEGGGAVGSHGLDHQLFERLTDDELQRQLVESRRRLEDLLGARVDALSLPGGSGGARALAAARAAGYRLVFGSRPGVVRAGDAAAALPRFAMRGHHGLPAFRAMVEQQKRARLRHGARYAAARALRAALGGLGYERLRASWVARRA